LHVITVRVTLKWHQLYRK